MLGAAGDASAASRAQDSGSRPAQSNADLPTEQPKPKSKHVFVDNVVMLAELTVKPEKLEEFLEYTVANLHLSRSYPGNLAFDILFDEAQPTKIVFYEVWTSRAAQKAYMTWRIQAGDLNRLLSFLAGEPKFTAVRSIAA